MLSQGTRGRKEFPFGCPGETLSLVVTVEVVLPAVHGLLPLLWGALPFGTVTYGCYCSGCCLSAVLGSTTGVSTASATL